LGFLPGSRLLELVIRPALLLGQLGHVGQEGLDAKKSPDFSTELSVHVIRNLSAPLPTILVPHAIVPKIPTCSIRRI
jgi:hypothetical protein